MWDLLKFSNNFIKKNNKCYKRNQNVRLLKLRDIQKLKLLIIKIKILIQLNQKSLHLKNCITKRLFAIFPVYFIVYYIIYLETKYHVVKHTLKKVMN